MLRNERSRVGTFFKKGLVLVLGCALGSSPLACGNGEDPSDNDERILKEALNDFGTFTAVRLDTPALAAAVRAGQRIRLPAARQGGGLAERELELTLRNLRAPELTEFVLKDAEAGSGSTVPLPPPSTYQGIARGGGVAVFTVTDSAIEGSMLVAPEGWSFIEPLEPQLRLRDVEPDTRRRLLRRYDHVVYNARDALGSDVFVNDDPGMGPTPGPAPPPSPLVLSIVADGDAALFRAYPLDSVMPFWLKQETLLNAVDWLYNCVEPEANANNAWARCDNDFDGGFGIFQARVRIDRLEVWTAGGPDSSQRQQLLEQSISMSHQSSPPCCGPPHTAGESSAVHFLSGRDLLPGAGLAAGVGGLNYYGPYCFDSGISFLCHHAVSQIVPSPRFRGTAFHQQSLVAHEIGHNTGGHEAFSPDYACWFFGEQCGTSLMHSMSGFNGHGLFVYREDDAQRIGAVLAEQLGSAAGKSQ